MKGLIFLSGGGNEFQTQVFDSIFFDTLKSESKFLYLPIALKGDSKYDSAKEWMDSVLSMHNRTDLKYETWNNLDDKTFIDLKSFDAVYIGGGNTWNLYKEIIDSGFDAILIKYINDGGIAYGGSAGAIIFGKLINTQNDDKEVDIKNEGLGLLGNLSIACHYVPESNDFYSKFAKDNGTDILCLYEESGVLFSNEGLSDCGSKKSLVIKSI